MALFTFVPTDHKLSPTSAILDNRALGPRSISAMMSLPETPSGAQPQSKQLSSRLLTMKFMQRAAASSPDQAIRSSSRAPASEPPSKRRRVDFQSRPTPLSPLSRTQSQPLLHNGPKTEQETQDGTGTPITTESDETDWILNINLPFVKSNSANLTNGDRFDEDDDQEDDVWALQAVGRQTYGSFKRKKAGTTPAPPTENDADLSSASDSDVPPTPAKEVKTSRWKIESSTKPSHNQARSMPPKRFFDQMNPTSPKQRKKKQRHNKKSRITI